MYLKQLEIQGFKSFANKTVVKFEEGITAVVGPNGSGKSNISDAMRWVLGEQSVKNLRGGKMEDVIFSGTDSRVAQGFAEVTLTLDNSDGTFPTEYAEIGVTRRMFRSGESEYYINKKACRLKDVRELFMDTGIGKDGYSIISQGRIDEILSSKSEDRRNIFEEAAGIVKYKSRKLESERKLFKTRENMVRIDDIILELEKQVVPLRAQAKKAAKYIELSDSLKTSEVELLCNDMAAMKQREQELASRELELKAAVEKYELDESRANDRLNELEEEVEAIESQLEAINEHKHDVAGRKNSSTGEINLLREKIENNKRYMDRTKRDITELESERDIVTNGAKDKSLLKEKLESEIADNEKILELKKMEIDKVSSQIDEEEKSVEASKETMLENLNRMAEIKLKLNTIESYRTNFQKRSDQIDTTLEELRSKEASLEKLIGESAEALGSVDGEVEALKAALVQLESERAEKTAQKNSRYQAIEKIKADSQSKSSSHKILKEMKEDYEGYYKGIKNFLQGIKNIPSIRSGIDGVVAELISVDKEFEKAIEVALGGSIQNIVAKDTTYAKESISFLKQNRLGRITFLPRDSIKARSLNEKEKAILQEPGVLGVASDIIKHDPKYRDIFGNLLGRVVIVDDIDNMVDISKRHGSGIKLVTLEGDVLNPGGSMTGGSFRGNSLSLIGRERQIKELEEELEGLRASYADVLSEYRSLEAEISSLAARIDENQSEKNKLVLHKNNMENRLRQNGEAKAENSRQMELIATEKAQISDEKQKLFSEKEEIENQILRLEEENALIQSMVDAKSKRFQGQKDERDRLNGELVSLQVSHASILESYRNMLENLENSERELKKIDSKISDSRGTLEKIAEDIEVLAASISVVEERIAEHDREIKRIETSLDEVKARKEQKSGDLKAQESRFREATASKEKAQNEYRSLELEKEKLIIQLDSIKSKLWEEYEMSFMMAQSLDKTGKSPDELKEIVAAAKRKLRELGNVNLDAIEELREIEERYSFLTSQRDDLVEAEKSLKYVIKEMNTKMREQFLSRFEDIRIQFKEIFVELFGGGRADVYITDKEDALNSGIEIVAEPPGKKLQNLSLLSGGERALTAISILFAILRTKPTPFCILDEIEAALDEANVYRYADYLKKFAEESQFIVITHRKGTMEAADTLYGVTMQNNGISELFSVRLKDIEKQK